uniref:Immunoglobulin C2-set-like ligand-binding domain-containing protein n=1 Tax=Periophthalmus magnuspinnatus TaxID=409849 RepID=A0A3B4AGH4_9GOBI
MLCTSDLFSVFLDSVQYLVTAPQKPELQIGTNFTATCFIKNTTEVTADDLRWKYAKGEIPPEQYTKISETALNVTITVTNETSRCITCPLYPLFN